MSCKEVLHIKVKTFEKDLAKLWAKMRKEWTGKGPLNAQVRVIDEIIFVKFHNEHSLLEQHLINFITADPLTEQRYYDYVKDKIGNAISDTLRTSIKGKEVKCTKVCICYDPVSCCNTVIIFLNANLEKLIRSGEVTTLVCVTDAPKA